MKLHQNTANSLNMHSSKPQLKGVCIYSPPKWKRKKKKLKKKNTTVICGTEKDIHGGVPSTYGESHFQAPRKSAVQ